MFEKWIETDADNERLNDNSVISVHEWMAVMAVMLIPVINIAMLIYWAYADKSVTPATKVNWARATLIVVLIAVVTIAVVAGLICLCYLLNDVIL